MAKTAKLKHDATANRRSRASKRASSPSIDTDKSLKGAPRASDATPVLGTRPNNGIQKSKTKQKPLKRGQRERQERGLARAEAVQAQMEKKLDSVNLRQKKRRERKVLWDEINDATKEEQRKAPRFQLLADKVENGGNEDEEWEDEPADAAFGDAEMKEVDGVAVPVSAPATKLAVVDRTASTAGSDVDDNIT